MWQYQLNRISPSALILLYKTSFLQLMGCTAFYVNDFMCPMSIDIYPTWLFLLS